MPELSDLDDLMSYGKQGFHCSQIMMLKALEFQGKDNPEAVRITSGFAGGLGFTGGLCGVLSGAVAVLGLYAGKGTPEDQEDPKLDFMIEDLVRWFKDNYGAKYGGCDCQNILGGNYDLQMERCPDIIIQTFDYVKELLVNNGFDLSGITLDD